MSQEDPQCFSGTDKIAERAGLVGENKFFVWHLVGCLSGGKKLLKELLFLYYSINVIITRIL
jgi:hypothetical protein